MEQTLFISDAAKKVHVEAHVLRYWEEELELPIKRNELGHRYYTEEDVKRFQEIRELKERGLQLKAIRLILKNGKLDRLADGENTQAEQPKRRKSQKRQAVRRKLRKRCRLTHSMAKRTWKC